MLWIPKVFMQIQATSVIKTLCSSLFGSQSNRGCGRVKWAQSFTSTSGFQQSLCRTLCSAEGPAPRQARQRAGRRDLPWAGQVPAWRLADRPTDPAPVPSRRVGVRTLLHGVHGEPARISRLMCVKCPGDGICQVRGKHGYRAIPPRPSRIGPHSPFHSAVLHLLPPAPMEPDLSPRAGEMQPNRHRCSEASSDIKPQYSWLNFSPYFLALPSRLALAFYLSLITHTRIYSGNNITAHDIVLLLTWDFLALCWFVSQLSLMHFMCARVNLYRSEARHCL